jgi:hypothetical protein
MKRLNWNTGLVGLGSMMLAASLLAAPASANEADVPARMYVPVTLDKNGSVSDAALSEMTAAVRSEIGDRSAQLVVLIHGFAATPETSREDFNIAADRLKAAARSAGITLEVVGIHWDAAVGGTGKWMAQATASRFVSLLGAKRAVKNPYLEKTREAIVAGRIGVRSVFFRLQDAFPETTLHGIAHSLGARVLVSAMAPDAGAGDVEQPSRTLRVGMAALIGADLDCDAFARKKSGSRLALGRAGVWWVTVPENGQADGVLELRRGAGKPDAIGNCGMRLEREDLDALLERRALVVDQKDIPAAHSMHRYLTQTRAGALAAAIAYLTDPRSADPDCILAHLDRERAGSACAQDAAAVDESDPCLKLYRTWRANPGATRFGIIQVRRHRGDGPAGQRRVGTQAGR